jgi:hypothetical protein
MSSRLHNKWHRHNHHTKSTPDPALPDSGHDPIASPDSPFQGDFVLNGSLSAFQENGTPAIQAIGATAIQATGNAIINGTLTTTNVSVSRTATNFPINVPVETPGDFLEVRVNNEVRYIRLWKIR